PAALIYWGLVFGFLSRRFEMEADIFGAAAVENPALFIHTLEHVAQAGRVARGKGSWRHFSIARRVDSLRKVFFEDPMIATRFWRRMKWVRLMMIGSSLVLFLLFAGDVAVDSMAGIGVLAQNEGHLERAESLITRASGFPGGGIHRWSLLKLYLETGRFDAAFDLLESLTASIDPGEAPEPVRLLHIELGLSALQHGDAALAMKTWKQGEANFPGDKTFPDLAKLTTLYLAGDQKPLFDWINALNRKMDKNTSP
ncbi:MAG: hypothetical protein KJ645_09180, partial [Planctomycetes bacterium]|nr:hypothetical protein [Planctomycetota bacterium]